MESWFSTFKSELGERFESYAQAKEKTFDYIEVFSGDDNTYAAPPKGSTTTLPTIVLSQTHLRSFTPIAFARARATCLPMSDTPTPGGARGTLKAGPPSPDFPEGAGADKHDDV